jgi:hypothetical protein
LYNEKAMAIMIIIDKGMLIINRSYPPPPILSKEISNPVPMLINIGDITNKDTTKL